MRRCKWALLAITLVAGCSESEGFYCWKTGPRLCTPEAPGEFAERMFKREKAHCFPQRAERRGQYGWECYPTIDECQAESPHKADGPCVTLTASELPAPRG